MKGKLASLVYAYLAIGLAVRILTGGAVLAFGTVWTMLFWPFVVAGLVVKLIFAALVIGVVVVLWRGRSGA